MVFNAALMNTSLTARQPTLFSEQTGQVTGELVGEQSHSEFVGEKLTVIVRARKLKYSINDQLLNKLDWE